MADKRISELTTVVTTANDADYVAVDGTGGTDATKRILVNDFESQIRNGLSDTELSILDGATLSTSELNVLDGITASTGELNILNGATITVSELNVLDGITATTAELNKLDGFTGDYEDLNYAESLNDTGITSTTFEHLKGCTSQLAGIDQGLGVYVKNFSNSATLAGSGLVLCDTTANAITLHLPVLSQSNLYRFKILLSAAGAGNVVTILNNSGDSGFINTDGSTIGTSIELDTSGDAVFLESYGGKYWAITWGTGHTLT